MTELSSGALADYQWWKNETAWTSEVVADLPGGLAAYGVRNLATSPVDSFEIAGGGAEYGFFRCKRVGVRFTTGLPRPACKIQGRIIEELTPFVPADPGTPAVPAATVLEDHFTRANGPVTGAPPTGPTPTYGADFASSGGAWGIASNKLAPSDVLTENMIWWNIGATSYVFTAKLDTLASGGTEVNSMVFRGNGAGQMWMIQANFGGTWELYVRNVGWDLIATSSVSCAAGQIVEITVTPTLIEVRFNGTLTFTSTDTTHAENTQVGFRAYSSTVRWDDVTVETPEIPAVPPTDAVPATFSDPIFDWGPLVDISASSSDTTPVTVLAAEGAPIIIDPALGYDSSKLGPNQAARGWTGDNLVMELRAFATDGVTPYNGEDGDGVLKFLTAEQPADPGDWMWLFTSTLSSGSGGTEEPPAQTLVGERGGPRVRFTR